MKTKNKFKFVKQGIGIRLSIAIAILTIISLTPMIVAYPLGLPALDLYTVLVDYMFGSFWISVLVVSALFLFMLVILGGLSMFTSLQFIMMFLGAMGIGYSTLTAILTFAILGSWTVYQVVRYVNSSTY